MTVNIRKVEYPYYHLFISENELKKDFERLKRYRPYFIKSKKYGVIFMIKINYEKDEKLLRITDYFSEECRIKCNRKDTISLYQFYQDNKESILEDLGNKVTHKDFDSYLYPRFKNFCSNFPVTISLQVLRYFKPKTWLDPSAGWGDRLVSAIAYGCEYVGTDPNSCMHPYYKSIIDTLGDGNYDKYQLIESPFEEFSTRRKFDMVFTSPPFFDLEEYSQEETQSVVKYPSLEMWIENFVKDLCMNSIKYCKKGGHIAFYVNNAKGINYVSRLKNYMKDKRISFLGTIRWLQGSYPKEILIWKKVN